MKTQNIYLAGWNTRQFSLEELESYLDRFHPPLIELSKDLVDGAVSTKGIKRLLLRYVNRFPDTKISFAGTTDFITCSGFLLRDYASYVTIQAAQARFLGATYFRFFIGKGTTESADEIINRLMIFSEISLPIMPLIELHNGWESKVGRIKMLLSQTPFPFVLDFENMHQSGLSYAKLSELLPQDRIAYFHTRNYGNVYCEHPSSRNAEQQWKCLCGDKIFLWEPKRLSKSKLLEIINED